MPRACFACGRVTFLASPRKVTQRRRPRRLAYSCDAQKKAERKKLAIAQTVFRSDRFFLPLLGPNQRGPVEPILDRFAKMITRIRMCGCELRRARCHIDARRLEQKYLWQINELRVTIFTVKKLHARSACKTRYASLSNQLHYSHSLAGFCSFMLWHRHCRLGTH